MIIYFYFRTLSPHDLTCNKLAQVSGVDPKVPHALAPQAPALSACTSWDVCIYDLVLFLSSLGLPTPTDNTSAPPGSTLVTFLRQRLEGSLLLSRPGFPLFGSLLHTLPACPAFSDPLLWLCGCAALCLSPTVSLQYLPCPVGIATEMENFIETSGDIIIIRWVKHWQSKHTI